MSRFSDSREFFDSREYQENTKPAENEINKMIQKNASEREVFNALRQQYPDDNEMVTKLYTEYESKMHQIRKKAQKFTSLLLTKYSQLEPRRILEKAKKYKKKYNFSDEEFDAFIRIALSDEAFSVHASEIPNTPLSRTLGHTLSVPTRMQYDSAEEDVLQEILKMNEKHKGLHTNVIIQSLSYKSEQECDMMLGKQSTLFNPSRDNLYTHVHPVLFALFAPRIKEIEDSMVLASISGIVKSRYEGKNFRSLPDWKLYNDLIQDPNEICIETNRTNSSLVDLRNRARVQCELWQRVRDLRNGQFYKKENSDFLYALKACRNNLFDSPENNMFEDEGSVLRKLMSVFSLRPTMIAVRTMSDVSPFTANYAINQMSSQQITTVPIINIRLPSSSSKTTSVALSSAFQTPDFYVEHKLIVPKTKEVVYSRGVLIFYVNRREYPFKPKELMNPQFSPVFNTLPFSMSVLFLLLKHI